MAEYEFTDEGVTAALDALGDDGPTVAEALKVLGHTGIQHDCFNCPVASYLQSLYRDCTAIAVRRDHIRLERRVEVVDENGYTDVHIEPLNVDTPDPIADFIAAFDSNDCPYPHLKRGAKR